MFQVKYCSVIIAIAFMQSNVICMILISDYLFHFNALLLGRLILNQLKPYPFFNGKNNLKNQLILAQCTVQHI